MHAGLALDSAQRPPEIDRIDPGDVRETGRHPHDSSLLFFGKFTMLFPYGRIGKTVAGLHVVVGDEGFGIGPRRLSPSSSE